MKIKELDEFNKLDGRLGELKKRLQQTEADLAAARQDEATAHAHVDEALASIGTARGDRALDDARLELQRTQARRAELEQRCDDLQRGIDALAVDVTGAERRARSALMAAWREEAEAAQEALQAKLRKLTPELARFVHASRGAMGGHGLSVYHACVAVWGDLGSLSEEIDAQRPDIPLSVQPRHLDGSEREAAIRRASREQQQGAA